MTHETDHAVAAALGFVRMTTNTDQPCVILMDDEARPFRPSHPACGTDLVLVVSVSGVALRRNGDWWLAGFIDDIGDLAHEFTAPDLAAAILGAILTRHRAGTPFESPDDRAARSQADAEYRDYDQRRRAEFDAVVNAPHDPQAYARAQDKEQRQIAALLRRASTT